MKSRKVFKWALIRTGVPNTYINVIKDMYEVSYTSVKSMYGEIDDFKMGSHQSSVLRLYLYKVVPWCMFFADSMVFVEKNWEEISNILN